jgi:DNA-binding response OmpR family regulator
VYGRILLVEDDPSIREVATLGLRAAGFEVSMAPDGVAGLERFATEPVDLVLLDTLPASTSATGTLRVYDLSAKDGSHEHVTDYPVLLTP